MKIVYNIAGTCHSGGMERVLANKANSLISRGYEVVIVTTDQHGEDPFFALDSRVRCIDLDINYEDNNGHSFLDKLIHYPGKQRRHKYRLTQVLMEEKADVCVSMFCNDVSFIADIADGSKKVLEIHFSKFKRLQYGRKGVWRLVDKLRSRHDESLVRRFDRFVVLTEEDREYWGPLPNIAVIPNARSFVPDVVAPLVAHKAVAVGRLTHQKGFERLVEAWQSVYERFPDWQLDIVGDGEERDSLQQLIIDHGLQDVVSLIPATNDVESVYLQSSLAVMSSRYEGLPMTLLESQACGVPSVCFACQCGPRDVIENGENGLLVPEGDVQALADGIMRLVADDTTRQTMGQRAREMSERYADKVIMNQWEKLFQDVTGKVQQTTIVVSAVNLRKGGTLTILRQCLASLSERMEREDLQVVALVHRRALCDYPGIRYIEIPWTVKGWLRRIWCEYVTMYRLSKDLTRCYGPIQLWLSLHDTTPRVKAEHQAVYCQTSFPFLRWKLTDLRFDPKIVLFACFTRFAYRFNVHRNQYLIVQARWLRDGFFRLLGLPCENFIIAPPRKADTQGLVDVSFPEGTERPFTFLYPASADCHKNFEVLCEAARLLENEPTTPPFRVVLTVKGEENRYAAWLKARWGDVKSIEFSGYMDKMTLWRHYQQDDCLVFPSRVETWGLPITEFGVTGKPLLLADLPYAHETAAGLERVTFFAVDAPNALKTYMKQTLLGKIDHCQKVPEVLVDGLVATGWKELFDCLLNVKQ